jgi:hypothetical protein
MARGEISYRKAKYVEAFDHLRRACTLSDNLVFAEPWGWMQPPRHALGALLLEQNKFSLSEAAYKEDLATYPDNIWSLTGLEEIYKRNNQPDQLKSIEPALTKARRRAKMPISVSCYCKKH